MKRTWTAATFAVALGCTATIFGQAGAGTTQTPSPQPGAQQPAGDAHRTVTVVGCVQRAGGAPGATGTSGVTGASASATGNSVGWILANASTNGATTPSGGSSSGNATGATNREPGAAGGTQSAGAAPVPAGAGGGANRGMSGSTYMLEPSTQPGSPDLSAHAGHKVEVTGTLAGMPNVNAAASATTGSASTGSARATTATAQTTADSMPAGQRLQVTSLKMISQTCS